MTIVIFGRPSCFLGADGNTVAFGQLEERLIDFGARIISLTATLPTTPAGQHIARQLLRSGTASALNYAEARGAERRADFIHKLGIVQKELNETSVWLRMLLRISLGKDDLTIAILQENVELARIVTASIRTARLALCLFPDDNCLSTIDH